MGRAAGIEGERPNLSTFAHNIFLPKTFIGRLQNDPSEPPRE